MQQITNEMTMAPITKPARVNMNCMDCGIPRYRSRAGVMAGHAVKRGAATPHLKVLHKHDSHSARDKGDEDADHHILGLVPRHGEVARLCARARAK
jgi:hypothetical protein